MLKFNETMSRVFDTPRLFFTLRGNRASEAVIEELREAFAEMGTKEDVECRVFESEEGIEECFESGLSPLASVMVFDCHAHGYFSPTVGTRHNEAASFPSWSRGAQWAVKVNPSVMERESRRQKESPAAKGEKESGKMKFRFARTCALQLRADFGKKFHSQLSSGNFPWGNPRKGEATPRNVTLPSGVHEIRKKLNEGPDLAAVIASSEYALELPKDSRISWLRIPPEPIQCDEAALQKVLFSLVRFEEVSAALLRKRSAVRDTLLAGVEIPMSEELREQYLAHTFDKFSVRRPDLHWTGEGIFASENDEMPGGLAEIAHVDQCYGVNQERWKKCFEWLASEGPVLFLVSHEWSKVYIPELTWLVAHMRKQGFQALLATTAELEDLEIREDGASWKNMRIGTVWRQFPIFETAGKTAELVRAAAAGKVRMVPEFAHFGNKTWFSVFRAHHLFFEESLSGIGDEGVFEILNQILPDSHLITGESSFPCTVAGELIPSLASLGGLPEDARNRLVLKICGANALASRSYGVLMGRGITRETWQGWIRERLELKQPFLVQRRLETGVAQLPVLNTKFDRPELFGCRILFRPWMIGGNIVTAHGCAVPSNTLRVHGRVDMAVFPVVFT